MKRRIYIDVTFVPETVEGVETGECQIEDLSIHLNKIIDGGGNLFGFSANFPSVMTMLTTLFGVDNVRSEAIEDEED